MVEIPKEIYDLPQASLLAKRRLDIHLAAHGFHESSTLRLYKHVSRPIRSWKISVSTNHKDRQDHLDHLLNTLRQLYTIKIGDESKYLGMIFE